MQTSLENKARDASRFRPDIEGLRAIAILLVVGYHANIPGFSGGYIGVDVFFVLSGYLITSLLVEEIEKSEKMNLKFYSRRARRLLPAMFVMLMVTIPIAAVIYAPFEQRVIANSAITTVAYVSNLYFAREATNYLGSASEINPYLHTWSLSVEEQFYFLWPVFVLFAFGVFRWQRKKKNRGRLILWMGALAIFSFVLTLFLMKKNQPFAFFSAPARAWEFAVGAITVLLRHNSLCCFNVTKNDGVRVRFIFWSLVGIAGIFSAAIFYDKNTLFPGFSALLPVIATAIILKAGESSDNNIFFKFLNTWSLQETGRISYSLYLWHWPVFVFAACLKFDLSLSERIILVFISFVIAELSYRFIEIPVKAHRIMTRKTVNALAMAVVITFAGIGVSYAWRLHVKKWEKLPSQIVFTEAKEDVASVYATQCHAGYPDIIINMEACVSGIKSAPRVLVLFGDSHAAQWYPAFEQMAMKDGWRLISLTKSSCPPIDFPLVDRNLGREYTECSVWRQAALDTIKEIKPDLVVVTSSKSYGIDPINWQTGLDKVVASLSAESRHVLLLKDTPRLKFDALMMLARREWSSNFLQINYDGKIINPANSSQIFEIEKDIARKYENVESFDMNRSVFKEESANLGDLVRNKVFLYTDSNHISASFSKTLGPELGRKIDKVTF